MSAVEPSGANARSESASAVETECCGGIGDPRMDCDSPLSAHLRGSAEEGREPCPTPLAWQQVLQSVEEQSIPWSIPFDHGRLSGLEFGQGPPVYFLNPAAGDHRLWMLFCWLLREERTCVLFDEPFWNRTPGPRTWLAGMTQAVEALIEHRGETSESHLALYGSGLGGLVALAVTRKLPEIVERVILQGAFSRRAWSPFERLLSLVGRSLPGPVRLLPGWSRIQEQNHRGCFPPFDPTRWDFLRDNLGQTPIARAAIKMSVAARAPRAEDWSDLTTPVLIIQCERDGAALTRLQEELAQAIPSCRQEWMHTSGHFPHVTHPHRLAKVVRPFLNLSQPIESDRPEAVQVGR